MLMGEYHHFLDEKNRIIIPSKLRYDLGQKVVITRGIDNCLFIYNETDFENIISTLKDIPFTKKDVRNFSRFFLSGATVVEFDRQGRITIPSNLLMYASLEKECIILGVGDRLEVWSKPSWNEFYNSVKENMSDIADELFTKNG